MKQCDKLVRRKGTSGQNCTDYLPPVDQLVSGQVSFSNLSLTLILQLIHSVLFRIGVMLHLTCGVAQFADRLWSNSYSNASLK